MVLEMKDTIGTPFDGCVCVSRNMNAIKSRCAHIRRMVERLPGLAQHFASMGRAPASDKVNHWFDGFRKQRGVRWEKDPPVSRPCDIWCPPAKVAKTGVGDCMDFSIVVMSAFLDANATDPGARSHLLLGDVCNAFGKECAGHAWVEGVDSGGPYVFETTLEVGPRNRRGTREGHYVPSSSYDGHSRVCVNLKRA